MGSEEKKMGSALWHPIAATEERSDTEPPPSPEVESPLDNPTGLRDVRMPFEQRLALDFESLSDLLEEVCGNISVGGMLIRTETPSPVGSVFEFEFLLGGEYSLIQGRGEVVWVRTEPDKEDQAAGMGVRFLDLVESSRNYIARMVQDYVDSGSSEFDLERDGPFEDRSGEVTAHETRVWKAGTWGGRIDWGDGTGQPPADEAAKEEALSPETEAMIAKLETAEDTVEELGLSLARARTEIASFRNERTSQSAELERLGAELEQMRREQSQPEGADEETSAADDPKAADPTEADPDDAELAELCARGDNWWS